MTTIAWCGRYVAADTQADFDDYTRLNAERKTRHVGDVVYASPAEARCDHLMKVEWM
jgi:hypothetical protein